MTISDILSRVIQGMRHISIPFATILMLALLSLGCNLSGSENANDVFFDRIDQANEAYENGEYDKAIAASNEAIDLFPDNPLPYMTRGNAYRGKNDYDQAIADFDVAIDFAPKFGNAEMTTLATFVAYSGRASS